MQSKWNKSENAENTVLKFPTLKEFESLIGGATKKKHLSMVKYKHMLLVPPYLREYQCATNPYSEIKTESTGNLKIHDRQRKEFDKKMKSYPVHENVSREVRMIYNANFKARAMQYSYDQMDSAHSTTQKSEESLVPKVDLGNTKYVGNVNFILDTRRVCLLELAVKIKEKQVQDLDKMVEVEQNVINDQYKCLNRDRKKEDDFLKSVCEKTSDILKIIHGNTQKRNSVLRKLDKMRFRLAKITSECIQLESDYAKFKSYKEFLYRCRNEIDKKTVMERNSMLGKAQIESFLNELELENKVLSEKSEDESKTDKHLLSNFSASVVMNVKTTSNTNNKEIHTKPSQRNRDIQKNLLPGSNNMNQIIGNPQVPVREITSTFEEYVSGSEFENLSDSESQEIPFKEPQDLVNVFDEMEITNLFLIENVQEQEETCETITRRTEKLKADININIAKIDNKIMIQKEKLKQLKNILNIQIADQKHLLKLNEVQRYKKIFRFNEDQLKTVDDIIEYFNINITKLYFSVFPHADKSAHSVRDMLREIEICVDSLFIEVKLHDMKNILQAMKRLDDKKRIKARIKRKQTLLHLERLKLQKAMDEANRPPRYRFGRKIISRSEPQKRIVKVMKTNVEDVRQEEYSFFFT